MMRSQDNLTPDLPETAERLEEWFRCEDRCRAYRIEARWGSEPACACCHSEHVRDLEHGITFEFAECGQRTTLTAAAVLEKSRKPSRVWFRASLETSAQHMGLSANDFQRLMDLGTNAKQLAIEGHATTDALANDNDERAWARAPRSKSAGEGQAVRVQRATGRLSNGLALEVADWSAGRPTPSAARN